MLWDFKCLHKAYSKPHLEDPCLAHCGLLNLSTLEGWKAKLKNHLSVPLQLLHFCFRNILHLLSLIISCLWGCFIDMLSLKRFQFELLQEGAYLPEVASRDYFIAVISAPPILAVEESPLTKGISNRNHTSHAVQLLFQDWAPNLEFCGVGVGAEQENPKRWSKIPFALQNKHDPCFPALIGHIPLKWPTLGFYMKIILCERAPLALFIPSNA